MLHMYSQIDECVLFAYSIFSKWEYSQMKIKKNVINNFQHVPFNLMSKPGISFSEQAQNKHASWKGDAISECCEIIASELAWVMKTKKTKSKYKGNCYSMN